MNRHEVLSLIRDTGVIAIVRGTPYEGLPELAGALRSGGVRAIEVTMNTPSALQMIHDLAAHAGRDVAVGAGTVLDAETARSAMLAGASFMISPSLSQRVIEACHRYGVLAIPGVMTPTEALGAWELGATAVKIFRRRLGPGYIKDLRGPLPQIEMIPVGGISLSNTAEFIRAGSIAVGVGGNLVDNRLVAERLFEVIAERAAGFVSAVREGRAEA